MNVLVSVVVGLLALAAAGPGLLALLGRLPGNGLVGVRTPETRRSPEAWQRANRAAAPGAIGAGVALGLGAVALALLGGLLGVVVAVASGVVALVLLNLSGLVGSKVAAQWQLEQEAQSGDGCCSSDACAPAADHPVDGGCADAAADPAADCGVTGGCGSCALSGMCESERAV